MVATGELCCLSDILLFNFNSYIVMIVGIGHASEVVVESLLDASQIVFQIHFL